jgi:transposase
VIMTRRKFSPEYGEEAQNLRLETSRPIGQLARKVGLHEEPMGIWVNCYRRNHAREEPRLTVSERARLPETKVGTMRSQNRVHCRMYLGVVRQQASYSLVARRSLACSSQSQPLGAAVPATGPRSPRPMTGRPRPCAGPGRIPPSPPRTRRS